MSDYPFQIDTARALPDLIRFGTSTWTYPGWKGLIYHKEYRSDKDFRSRCLKEYSHLGLFRTVGIDRSFYRPLSRSDLQGFAQLIPENFSWVSKVWERITIPQFPNHARYGKDAGKMNPDFLNSSLFCRDVLEPYRCPEVQKHTGPFVFQFQTIHRALLKSLHFLDKLHSFLEDLPSDFEYAIELRNPDLLTERYFSILNNSGATHVFNHWNYMPSLTAQMVAAAKAGGLSAPFFVSRILTPKGVGYKEAVNLFEPYKTIQQRDPEMRRDVLRLVKRALKRGSRAYIIVNNRAEGNSPMTINELVQQINW